MNDTAGVAVRRLPPSVLALSPGTLGPAGVPEFVRRVERALDGGLEGLLVREAALPDSALLALLSALGPSLRAHDAWLGVHDAAHLAAIDGGDVAGLHLGFRSLPLDAVRRIVPPGLALGLSTHASDDVASWSTADYLFHGPVRETPSKVGLLDPVGFEGLSRAVASARAVGAGADAVVGVGGIGVWGIGVWGIGGLRPEDAASVRETGARGMAVLRGILGASDPARAATDYREAWEAGA